MHHIFCIFKASSSFFRWGIYLPLSLTQLYDISAQAPFRIPIPPVRRTARGAIIIIIHAKLASFVVVIRHTGVHNDCRTSPGTRTRSFSRYA